jgi:2-hydroxychromene-2-carboxylate isomerase
VLRLLGKDADAVIAEANGPAAHERLKSETDAAREYGIFGSPAFVVEGETFWGTTAWKKLWFGPTAAIACKRKASSQ